MTAQPVLYQELLSQIFSAAEGSRVRKTSMKRLGLLVLGILAAESCVLAKMAAKLFAFSISDASRDSINRRLRRTLADEKLDPEICYEPILRKVLDWNKLLRGSKRVLLIVDESSKEDEIHLFRVSLAYWGGIQPLVWTSWKQNEAQPEGSYWKYVDAVLTRVAALIPPGLGVIVTADRAYSHPPFLDRIAAYGWHWLVRAQIGSSLRFLDHQQRQHELGEIVRRHLNAPGTRWKTQGLLFKNAGWRKANLAGIWACGQKEPLVVISDMPLRWELINLYGRRFWTEAGFRNDKSRGWQWEDSQVKEVAHHERLLLAFAWACLLVNCLGAQEANARRQKLVQSLPSIHSGKRKPAKPEHARESIFTMGLRCAYCWLTPSAPGTLQWHLPDIDAISWFSRWYHEQSCRYVLKTVRP